MPIVQSLEKSPCLAELKMMGNATMQVMGVSLDLVSQDYLFILGKTHGPNSNITFPFRPAPGDKTVEPRNRPGIVNIHNNTKLGFDEFNYFEGVGYYRYEEAPLRIPAVASSAGIMFYETCPDIFREYWRNGQVKRVFLGWPGVASDAVKHLSGAKRSRRNLSFTDIADVDIPSSNPGGMGKDVRVFGLRRWFLNWRDISQTLGFNLAKNDITVLVNEDGTVKNFFE